MAVTFPLAASARRTASVGVPRSTAISKLTQHRGKPLTQVIGNAVKQERFGAQRARALLAHAEASDRSNIWRPDDIDLSCRARAILPRRIRDRATGLQHERACFGKAGYRVIACLLAFMGGMLSALRLARSTLHCRRCAHPAASRLTSAWAYARPAGQKLSLIEPPTARGSAFHSGTIPALACCRWKPSPTHRPTIGHARPCATTTFARKLVQGFKYSDRLDLAPDDGAMDGACRPRAIGRGRRADPGPVALAQAVGAAVQSIGRARRRDLGPRSCAGCHGSLKRVRATPQQVGLSKTERADNVQGAFRVPAEHGLDIAGRRVVLIDDVLTSGATVDACARALLRAGAAHIDVLVFARVVAPARAPI